MLFNSFEYLLFLPIVVVLYWVMPARAKIVLLIAASYVFYMSAFKIYGLLLFGLTAVNYLIGLLVHAAPEGERKRLALIAGITINLGVLALFKYTNFILESVNNFLGLGSHWLKLWQVSSTGFSDLPIILPLGISFFVFEFIHYLSDIFKGDKPIRNPMRFALFASFFPSQIAGPIKRYQDFDKQLDKWPAFESVRFYSGMWLIAQGLFKKVALGDNLSPIVRAGFESPHLMGTGEAWICTLAFAFQIYFDFSGYTDIGRGSAMLLGFSLPENFNMPYLARSLREFWHRWHISLSTWLRDYLYIPLGGSKGGETKTSLNLLTTMLLGGLWHGASWTFVVWGAFHGLGLAVNRWWDGLLSRSETLKGVADSLAGKCIAYGVTFVAVLVGWVLFRAKGLGEALSIYQAMFSWKAPQAECAVMHLSVNSVLPAAISLYVLFQLAAYIYRQGARALEPHVALWTTPEPACAEKPLSTVFIPARALTTITAFVIIFVLTMSMAPADLQPFIYFQF